MHNRCVYLITEWANIMWKWLSVHLFHYCKQGTFEIIDLRYSV